MPPQENTLSVAAPSVVNLCWTGWVCSLAVAQARRSDDSDPAPSCPWSRCFRSLGALFMYAIPIYPTTASGVGSGRENWFLPRAGTRIFLNFTHSTQLSRPCPTAGLALPLLALPSGMHGHSRQQFSKAPPFGGKGKRSPPTRQRRVTNDRC